MNLGLLKPTEMKNNQRVIMPDPLSTEKENILTTIGTIFEECIAECIEEDKREGKKNEYNGFTKENLQGLKELKKLKGVKAVMTDKSRKHGIVTESSHQKYMSNTV